MNGDEKPKTSTNEIRQIRPPRNETFQQTITSWQGKQWAGIKAKQEYSNNDSRRIRVKCAM